MRKELFEPCKNAFAEMVDEAPDDQRLNIILDMLDWFADRFMFLIPTHQINEAVQELMGKIQQKKESMAII